MIKVDTCRDRKPTGIMFENNKLVARHLLKGLGETVKKKQRSSAPGRSIMTVLSFDEENVMKCNDQPVQQIGPKNLRTLLISNAAENSQDLWKIDEMTLCHTKAFRTFQNYQLRARQSWV